LTFATGHWPDDRPTSRTMQSAGIATIHIKT
jgi:hypothetical protein